MSYDKQLRGLALQDILEKRRLDQALNAKEFSLAAGVSYSTAREWFRLPGFPVIKGFVFWGDFVQWRHDQISVVRPEACSPQETKSSDSPASTKAGLQFPGRAAQILREAS